MSIIAATSSSTRWDTWSPDQVLVAPDTEVPDVLVSYIVKASLIPENHTFPNFVARGLVINASFTIPQAVYRLLRQGRVRKYNH